MRGLIRVLFTLVTACCVALVVGSCNQPLPPIQPEPGLPCGYAYVLCPATGGCCHASDEVCGQEGHACGLGDCCYVGSGGSLWGARPPRKQLTHDQVRAIESGGGAR